MHNNNFSQEPQTKKVGVVIPIYNVAEYLRECLDSVINQTYKNLSIVLVNDGSTDNNESLNIAKEYVAKDSRFILIDKENGGLSSARNVGIAWFSGKFETKLESNGCYTENTCHTESLGEVSKNLEDKKDISLFSKAQYDNTTKHINNINKNMDRISLDVYNVANENPYNIYKIYANNTTQNTDFTHNTNNTIQRESDTDPTNPDFINSHIERRETSQIIDSHKDDSILTQNNKNQDFNNTLQPQKIDYIIFLDSDDYWKPYTIEECIKHSDGVDIVWFDFLPFYENDSNKKWRTTMQEYFGFHEDIKLSGKEWLERCVTKNINSFYFAWSGLIDFKFLKDIKLYFLNGVIHEDHGFGCLLFLQAKNIYVLKDKPYLYRIRENSIINTRSNTPVPHYAKHIYDTFSDREMAKQYHKKSSMFLMMLQLIDFLSAASHKHQQAIQQTFLPFYAAQCEALITSKQDPLNIVCRIHEIKPYLKRGFKYRHRIYMKNETLYNLLKPIFDFYDLARSIKKSIRKSISGN